MDVLQAIVLGVIEGLTEFLPISSTGHLIVAEDLMRYKDTAEIFTVIVQLGTVAAVLWFYRRDLIQKILGLIRGDKTIQKFWLSWIIATIPALAIGFLLKDQVSKYSVSLTVAIALIAGGIAIWLIETYHHAAKNMASKPKLEDLTQGQAVKVGLYQVLALIPGVSRSGATIMGGLLSGMDRVTATAFSFYLSMPILLLAGAYKILKAKDDIGSVSGGVLGLLLGTVAAFITALLVIKWLLRYVSHHDFKIFAYYRIILGLIILVALTL